MSSTDLNQQQLAQALAMAASQLMRSCVNCCHFNQKDDADFCAKHGAKPPARIIVAGCSDYDDLPF